ncbi:unnamed protein product [Bursaphelenchus xylophilus]|uniref:(pine wood nematode) hypothetical protein n=1 Tax=Bursaphelenchus xylophilus TaxID=6326 RepID=A0A1I7RI58_BURXY|nr:unnamed protein product [Bursaphelenchus xylophilus]CAG9115139.1 unnamed protein product [Bursaphelenchus xylophilus]
MAFEFIDEFDVLAKWPNDQRNLLESKNWKERIEGLESLQKLMNDHPRLATTVSYSDLVTRLKMIVIKDMNVNVVANSIKLITGLVRGLREHFDHHSTVLAPILFEKFKEQKEVVKAPLIECTEALIEYCSIDRLPNAMEEALKKPHPAVKQQLNVLTFKILTHFSQHNRPMAFIKAVIPRVVKNTTEADKNVRDTAFLVLGGIVRLIGDKATQTLADGSQWNDEKIKEYSEKAKEDAEKWAAEHAVVGENAGPAIVQNGQTSENGTEEKAAESAEDIDPWDLLEPRDIIKDLPKEFDEWLVSKKWQERKEALEALLASLEKHPKLVPDLEIFRGLIGELKRIIEKDSNVIVVSLAVKSVQGVVKGLRHLFEPVLPSVFLALITKSKEKKEVFADALNKCLDEIANYIHLHHFSEHLLTALSNQNPHTRRQFLLFIGRIFNKLNQKTAPRDQIKILAPRLSELTSDATPDVRDGAYTAIGAIARCIGDQGAEILFKDLMADSIKKPKIEEKKKQFDEEFGPNVAPEMAKIYAATAGPPLSAKPTAKPASAVRTQPRPVRSAPPARPAPSPKPAPVRVKPASASIQSAAKRPILPPRPLSNTRPAGPRPNVVTSPKPTPNVIKAQPNGSAPVPNRRQSAPIRPNVVRAPQMGTGVPYRPPMGVSKINNGRTTPVIQPPNKSSSLMAIARSKTPASTDARPSSNFYAQRSMSNIQQPRSLTSGIIRPRTGGLSDAPSVSNPGSRQSSQTRIDLNGAKPSRLRPPSNASRIP